MYYLEISVIIKEPQISVNSNIIETCIMKCLKQFVGEEGCKDKFEILKYDDSNQKIILRCSNESYIRLRASLVLSNNCEEQTPFSFVINRATENLLSLRCNSRTFKHGGN
ncbi:uncharacterized protein LOC122508083 [Leptopilina heterotoma]|uniref:uncharacterized protein LOC122508083 n=1 Tax=Leptopilina heterotoma TaxID=63436 RepID=UPI001CA97BC5|nr:uncharacterized protein LOC122508083 [Leptopilina heterotoma]